MIDGCGSLEASIDVDALSFDDVMAILRSYVDGLLSAEASGARLGLSADLQIRCRELLERVARRPEPDAADRVAGWRLHDASAGADSVFAAVAVLCTYDRDSAEFDIFGPEAMMESILATVCALGEGYGPGFVDHARRSAAGQRCLRAAAP